MRTLQKFLSFLKPFSKSKKRRTRNKKRVKKHTRRNMRGG